MEETKQPGNSKKRWIALWSVAIVISVLLLAYFILKPNIEQAIYDEKMENLVDGISTQLQEVQQAAAIEEEATLADYLDKLAAAIKKVSYEDEFEKLNMDFSEVNRQKTLQELGLEAGMKDRLNEQLMELNGIADSIKSLNEQTKNRLLDDMTEETQVNTILEELMRHATGLRNRVKEGITDSNLTSAIDSINLVLSHYTEALGAYKSTFDSYVLLQSLYQSYLLNINSVKTWQTLYDNTTDEETKTMCQQKIQEYSEKANAVLPLLKETSIDLQNKKGTFEQKYLQFEKRLDVEQNQYGMAEKFQQAIDQAAALDQK